jgi:choline dehydrogenase-like flavoprotein
VIIDGDDPSAGPTPHVDVCVVGSGPAGIAIVDRLLGRGRSVLVVESGPLTESSWAEELNAGEDAAGTRFGFQTGRRRVVGGNDGFWWGQCVRLEDDDFTARPWIPMSGWPIGPRDLDGFYADAERWYDVGHAATAGELDAGLGREPALTGSPDFEKRATVFSRTHRHARDLLESCSGSERAHLLHSATAVDLELTQGRVTGLRTRSRGGAERTVTAETFVLAAGGIENPRLLLLADRTTAGRSGLNPHGLVGRYLQEHPSRFQGRVLSPDPVRLQREFVLRYKARHRFWPKLVLSAAAQERHGALGATAALVTRFGEDSSVEALKALVGSVRARRVGADSLRQVGRVLRDSRTVLPQFAERLRGFAPTSATRAELLVQVQLEQTPDAANRIRLSDRVDALGTPLAAVDLRVSEQTEHTLAVVTRALDTELRSRGLGRVDPEVGHVIRPEEHGWAMAHHHAGTTRMAADATRGVVDADCRVHGAVNLFVAGSSVFPTSGWANPTLTIVALAFRLADHLDRRLPRR